jgi:hypothetical protein
VVGKVISLPRNSDLKMMARGKISYISFEHAPFSKFYCETQSIVGSESKPVTYMGICWKQIRPMYCAMK